MHGFEELNAKINRLKREGGVGHTEPGKSITWDGNTDGKVVFGGGYVQVSTEPIDLASIKSISATAYNGQTFTLEDETFVIVTEGLIQLITIGDEPAVLVCLEEHQNELFGENVQKGTYFVKLPTSYTSAIQCAETIHPISDKYLSGVCLPVVEFSFEGDTFTSTPAGWHTTTQECSDALDAIISKESPAFLAILPHPQCTFATLFTRFGDCLSEYDHQMHPRYVAHKMWENGGHWLLDLRSGDIDWGEHDKWMMGFKTFDS